MAVVTKVVMQKVQLISGDTCMPGVKLISFLIANLLFSSSVLAENLWSVISISPTKGGLEHSVIIESEPVTIKGSAKVEFIDGLVEIRWKNEFYPEDSEFLIKGRYKLSESDSKQTRIQFMDLVQTPSPIGTESLDGNYIKTVTSTNCTRDKIFLYDPNYLGRFFIFSREGKDCISEGGEGYGPWGEIKKD
jgi:hypothetical protein